MERDDGFTLLELMVVILVVAILLAIAIPTFLGARRAANDRAAQSNLRNAHTNAFIFYADHRIFTESPSALTALDPSLTYTTDHNALTTVGSIYVAVSDTSRPDDTVLLGTKSGTGTCFYIRTIGDENHPRFASDRCEATSADDLTFIDAW